jgi:hypothetical protein
VDAAILRGRIFPQLESAFEAILSAVGFILGDVVDHDHFPAPLDSWQMVVSTCSSSAG